MICRPHDITFITHKIFKQTSSKSNNTLTHAQIKIFSHTRKHDIKCSILDNLKSEKCLATEPNEYFLSQPSSIDRAEAN